MCSTIETREVGACAWETLLWPRDLASPLPNQFAHMGAKGRGSTQPRCLHSKLWQDFALGLEDALNWTDISNPCSTSPPYHAHARGPWHPIGCGHRCFRATALLSHCFRSLPRLHSVGTPVFPPPQREPAFSTSCLFPSRKSGRERCMRLVLAQRALPPGGVFG